MWILFSISPALISLPSEAKNSLGILGYVGILVWALGFLIEIIAGQVKIKSPILSVLNIRILINIFRNILSI